MVFCHRIVISINCHKSEYMEIWKVSNIMKQTSGKYSHLVAGINRSISEYCTNGQLFQFSFFFRDKTVDVHDKNIIYTIYFLIKHIPWHHAEYIKVKGGIIPLSFANFAVHAPTSLKCFLSVCCLLTINHSSLTHHIINLLTQKPCNLQK